VPNSLFEDEAILRLPYAFFGAAKYNARDFI
jgi:hypothetical protein